PEPFRKPGQQASGGYDTPRGHLPAMSGHLILIVAESVPGVGPPGLALPPFPHTIGPAPAGATGSPEGRRQAAYGCSTARMFALATWTHPGCPRRMMPSTVVLLLGEH